MSVNAEKGFFCNPLMVNNAFSGYFFNNLIV